MKFRLITGLLLLVFMAVTVSAQGKKTIREKKIATLTVYEYFIEEGYDEPVVESIEKYNEQGDVVEIQDFNKKGEVKRWEKYAYNEKGDLVEEIFLDLDGKVARTEKNIIVDGLRIEKHYLNPKGKIYKKKVYKYEYRQ